MRVYSIENDVSHYQYFLPAREDEGLPLRMDCTPKAEVWSPPPVFIYRPTLKGGDFYQFHTDLLITSPRATDVLLTHLEMAGELLPLPHQGVEYTILNVLECINCLDQEATEWRLAPRTGERISPKKYVFHSDRFSESMLFKIPETRRGEILVVEGLHDPEEEFRFVVEHAGLKGLLFEELWTDEE
jgi:hypothetical protein